MCHHAAAASRSRTERFNGAFMQRESLLLTEIDHGQLHDYRAEQRVPGAEQVNKSGEQLRPGRKTINAQVGIEHHISIVVRLKDCDCVSSLLKHRFDEDTAIRAKVFRRQELL